MDQHTFQILNTLGTWLAGIGTLSAVIVSLYLARRGSKIKLKINAGHRILVGSTMEGKYPDYCSIRIVNTGFRQANLTELGWKVGLIKKEYAIQTTEGLPFCSEFPISLKDGEEASFLIPFKSSGNVPNWIDEFPKDFLPKWPKILVNTIKIQVFTSIGKTFERRIEKRLRKKLLESYFKGEN